MKSIEKNIGINNDPPRETKDKLFKMNGTPVCMMVNILSPWI